MSRERHAVIRHTFSVAFATTLSKALGFVREILMMRYLGVSGVADAFVVAFRLPNSLRKIFAEGALSAAFVPALVTTVHKEGRYAASGLVSAGALLLQLIIGVFCGLIAWFAPDVMCILAPGWCLDQDAQRLAWAVSLVRILIFFISTISLSSLLAGALQAVHRYTVPAYAQILMNALLCVQLLVLSLNHLSVMWLAWCILCNGCVMVAFHGFFYLREGFTFVLPNREQVRHLRRVLYRFLHCCVGGGAMEINAFIDQMIASYLPAGSIALINYTSAFIRIPLGIIAVPFSNIMLTKFSRVALYAPQRLGYYLYEGARCMIWCCIPATLLLGVFSYRIFYIFMYSSQFSLDHVAQAQLLVCIGALMIFWTAYNKILENAFYALQETSLPTIATMVSVVINIVLSLALLPVAGAAGVVSATVIATMVRTILMLVLIHVSLKIPWYGRSLARFVGRFIMQLACVGWIVYIFYHLLYQSMTRLPASLAQWMCWGWGYWFWVGPLCAAGIWLLYATRRTFKTTTYFLA